MEAKRAPLIEGLKATMRAVTPPALWTAFSERGRKVFYWGVCWRAGLSPSSPEAQRAFAEVWNEERGRNEQ